MQVRNAISASAAREIEREREREREKERERGALPGNMPLLKFSATLCGLQPHGAAMACFNSHLSGCHTHFWNLQASYSIEVNLVSPRVPEVAAIKCAIENLTLVQHFL